VLYLLEYFVFIYAVYNMKYTWLFVSGATAAAVAKPSYLEWTADSFIKHGVEKDFHYTKATLYEGYRATVELTKNATIADWYQGQVDALLQDDGTIIDWNFTHYSLDDYRMGNNFLWWYERTGEEKYKSAARVIREQLDRHPQNSEGGFWHRSPVYANQMWLDGIFMADTFYAKWTAEFDSKNATAWNHIVRQFDLIEKYTRNHTTGLLVHGYDQSKSKVWADPVTGAAPHVWNRAMGWYFIALLEVLPLLPEKHEGRAKLTKYFTTLAAGLKKTQDSSGGWWLIMDEPYPGKKGNYIESSGTAMFTYGFLKGIKAGLLSKKEYEKPAKKGYELMTKKFVKKNADGTLNWEGTVEVGSLSGNGTYEVSESVSSDVGFRLADFCSTISVFLWLRTTTRVSDLSCWLLMSGRRGSRREQLVVRGSENSNYSKIQKGDKKETPRAGAEAMQGTRSNVIFSKRFWGCQQMQLHPYT
jgi:rhamnogalacturonyl hydrolase YesR